MVETGRCFASQEAVQPLSLGLERKIDLQWQLNDDGLQTPKAMMDGNAVALWLLDEAWYVCEQQQVVGRAISNLQPEQIRHFLKAPSLPPSMAKAVHDKLSVVYPQQQSMLLKVLEVVKPKQGIKPRPIVHLDFYQEKDISAKLPYYMRDLYESIRLSMEKKVRDAIKDKGMARSHIVILDALLKLRQVCCHSKLLKLDSAKKAHKHSSKLDMLAQMLPDMVEEGRRILIFSQFTTMLQLIEELIIGLSIDYVKLTGRTRDRETPINAFQNGDVPIFLISLKAGGTGLNLTAADTVIHYDPWWNPAAEDQATDRAHRIGQKNKVFVYKLLTEGTVEQTILQMQQKKRALIEGVFDKQQASSLKLTGDDLNQLFQPL